MRLVAVTPLVVLLLLIQPITSFVVPSLRQQQQQLRVSRVPSGTSSSSSSSSSSSFELHDIPSSLNVDLTLPSWFVENGNSVLHTLENLKLNVPAIDVTATTSAVPLLSSSSAQSIWSTLLSLTTTTLPLSSPFESWASSLDATQLELFNSLVTPWHLQAITVFGIGSTILWFINLEDDFSQEVPPYESGTTTYSPELANQFYNQRPILVLKRILKLALLTGSFNTGILFDWLVLGKLLKDENYTALRSNESRRAKVALRLCEQLGPTFIKLGQALSIRTDLIPEAYALELRQLQDAVPPFSSTEARDVLRTELGVTNLNDIFSNLSDQPVASASIGQVYRGTLARTGQDVAVKVQRPGILNEIALDLYVLRLLTPIQTKVSNFMNGVQTTPEDIETAISLVDEWGRGFVAETDYRLEAMNTQTFQQAMIDRGLNSTICAPPIIEELVRDKVLVTEWIEGTRLDRDASSDVPRLCGVAINAYLTMLLDTGVLHCDPHPGNLLRTTDGKLCILDWGMTLEVPSDLQYALLELIAHINVEDYDSIPQDFINLGFSPDGVTSDKLKESGITEGLTFAFRQLSQGGGPKKIQERVKAEFQERYGSDLSDTELQAAARTEMLQRMEEQLQSEGVDVKGVTNVMEEMSKRNRELFQLPPYVLYVARAFSTLEGIGLSIDDNYAIVQECYPYLARRLFTDRSPRAKKALKAMLGLSEEEETALYTHNNNNNNNNGSSDPQSALAFVQAGTHQATSSSSKKSGSLSPKKLMEMSDGFASYTAATTEVDRDGAGQAAAATELAKLLLDPKGSTLQDILVEETAKLGDAATRAALRASLVDSAPAKAAASAFRTQKELVEQSPLANFFPSPLKTLLVDRPAEFPELIEALLSTNPDDEKILTTATELRDVLSSRLQSNGGGVNEDEDGTSPMNELDTEAIRVLLSDKATRDLILEQGPGVATLGRRLGAGLLRRAAYRTDRVEGLPEDVRARLSETNRRLAQAIDVSEEV